MSESGYHVADCCICGWLIYEAQAFEIVGIDSFRHAKCANELANERALQSELNRLRLENLNLKHKLEGVK